VITKKIGLWSTEHRPLQVNLGTGDQTIPPALLSCPTGWDEDQLLISYQPPRSGADVERMTVAKVLADLTPYQTAGWDGEDAAALAQGTLEAVRDLLIDLAACALATPDVAPAVDGSVCMEWHFARDRHEIVIFIDIGPAQKVMSFVRGLGPQPEERHFDIYNGAAKRHVLTIFDRVTHKTFG
jgi:hypothetical protein